MVYPVEGDDIAAEVVELVGVNAPQNLSPSHEMAVIRGESIDGLGARVEVGACEI